jgi:hypothetical protein
MQDSPHREDGGGASGGSPSKRPIGMPERADARTRLAAYALRGGAVLVWLAAALHFFAVPLLRGEIERRLTSGQFAFVWPPFAFSFILDGILLLPLGLTAHYCAGGILRGERPATRLGLVTALTVLALPIVLVAVTGVGYLSAPLFAISLTVIVAAGLGMTVPLLRIIR